jgi:hypothetical protein
MGFEPMTCALRGPSKASSWVLPGRNESHKGRSKGVKLETMAIRCNSLRRLETQLLGQDLPSVSLIVTLRAPELAVTKRNRSNQIRDRACPEIALVSLDRGCGRSRRYKIAARALQRPLGVDGTPFAVVLSR